MEAAAATCRCFSEFPNEIRLNIWTHALPGPRIIHVERHFLDKEKDSNDPRPRPGDPPNPTYFMSRSSNTSIKWLLRACKESYEVVTKHYSRIFSHSPTWFCYAKDYLYIDSGTWESAPWYFPNNFILPHEPVINPHHWCQLGIPEYSPEVVRLVRNLILCSSYSYPKIHEQWLVENLLSVFTGVKVLVFVDQFHGELESEDEFVWLEGNLTDELEESMEIDQQLQFYRQRPLTKQRIEPCRALKTSLVWREFLECRMTAPVSSYKFRNEWEKRMYSREVPKLFKKTVTTRAMKKGLLEICGSEESYWKFRGCDQIWVEGYPQYSWHLTLSQQVAFLEFALKWMWTNKPDSRWSVPRGEWCIVTRWEDFLPLFARLDDLVTEWGFEELIIAEAEERG